MCKWPPVSELLCSSANWSPWGRRGRATVRLGVRASAGQVGPGFTGYGCWRGAAQPMGRTFGLPMGDAQEPGGQSPQEIRNLNTRDKVNVRFLGTTDRRGAFLEQNWWGGHASLRVSVTGGLNSEGPSLGMELLLRVDFLWSTRQALKVGTITSTTPENPGTWTDETSRWRPAGQSAVTWPQTLGLVYQLSDSGQFLTNTWNSTAALPIFSPWHQLALERSVP